MNCLKQRKWVPVAEVAFEKYFIHKMKNGTPEPICEERVLPLPGIEKLRA